MRIADRFYMSIEDDEISEVLDLASGIGLDGAVVAPEDQASARRTLNTGGKFSDVELSSYKRQREAELVRDDSDRVRGCSFQNCQRPAVWERVFEKSGNAALILGLVNIAGAASFSTFGAGVFIRGISSTNFDVQRLGSFKDKGRSFVRQWGCWGHIGGFVNSPSGGSYSYHIVSASLPKSRPHTVFQISEEAWKGLQIIQDAQNLGVPEGPREFCGNCGLPNDPNSGKGIKAGEGDDYWRTFCAYCGNEVKPEEP
jgi:hypothetical protein